MITLLWWAGCVATEPSTNPFRPAPAADPPTAPAEPPPPTGPQGDFDFEQEARPAPEPAPETTALPAPAPAPNPAAPVWDPSKTLPDTSFGVRVVAVLVDVQPPRAVLGLADGQEVVVSPGSMLPAQGLVVLAIGKDAVQVAHVSPNGFSAKVEVSTVQALYR